jgi:hypothetical protein
MTLEDAVAFEDALPLALEPLVQPPAAPLQELWRDTSLKALQAVALLDERHAPVEGHGTVEAELDRLHRKLDLLIEFCALLVRQSLGAAAPRALRVCATGLRVLGALPGDPAGPVLVRLGLHAASPQPFTWPAEAHHQDGVLTLRFQPLPEALARAFERYVFTRHRRAVAGSRQLS